MILERLQPYWMKNPDDSWEQLIDKAYLDRVCLTATGFYKTPDIGWDGKKGNPWNYFSTGTAATIVELDCLTGRFEVIQHLSFKKWNFEYKQINIDYENGYCDGCWPVY